MNLAPGELELLQPADFWNYPAHASEACKAEWSRQICGRSFGLREPTRPSSSEPKLHCARATEPLEPGSVRDYSTYSKAQRATQRMAAAAIRKSMRIDETWRECTFEEGMFVSHSASNCNFTHRWIAIRAPPSNRSLSEPETFHGFQATILSTDSDDSSTGSHIERTSLRPASLRKSLGEHHDCASSHSSGCPVSAYFSRRLGLRCQARNPIESKSSGSQESPSLVNEVSSLIVQNESLQEQVGTLRAVIANRTGLRKPRPGQRERAAIKKSYGGNPDATGPQ